MEYNFDDYFTIEKCRKQLRVYHNEDDEEIKEYAEMALSAISSYINRDIYPETGTVPEGDDYSILINKGIRGACFLLLSDLYENRTISLEQSANKNPVFDLLLGPHMNYAVRAV